MFACRWFRVFAFVSAVAKAVQARSAEQVIPARGLTQDQAEIILNAQSNLRRHLIGSLADVGEKIIRFDRFHSVVNGLIQDLQSRNLDPFKSFNRGIVHGQSTPSGVAETIYNLQDPTTLADWKSLLQTIPDFVPSRPNVRLTAEHLEIIHGTGEPFVAAVLTGIQKNHIKLNKKLLGDVLYNYRFGDHSPDTEVISDNLKRMLEERPANFSDFRPDPSAEGPDAILSDILKYVARKSDTGVAHQIAQLLPALSDAANVLPLDPDPDPRRLFDAMAEDDYPDDIVRAKNALSSAIGNNQTGLELSKASGGRSPMEKLLMLIAELTSLSGRTSLRKKVHALHPHVKLRYLASRGKFFRPRTAADVGFLLNSFLTAPDESNPTLFREIRKVFSDFNWEEGLKNFDYSRYSKPRPLVMDMFENLLNTSKKLPVCGVILLSYFLKRNHREVPAHPRNDDFFIEELIIPTDKNKASYPTTTASVKRCPDGPPLRIVDPESIIEAMSPNRHSDFISTLIRSKPMPIGYATSRRIDIFRRVLNGLGNSEYNEGAIIEKILLEMPLNEKADLPPKYVDLCPYEVAAMEARRPSPKSTPPIKAPSRGFISVDSLAPATPSIPPALSSTWKATISPFPFSLMSATSSGTDEAPSETNLSPRLRSPFLPDRVAKATFPQSLASLDNSSPLVSSPPDYFEVITLGATAPIDAASAHLPTVPPSPSSPLDICDPESATVGPAPGSSKCQPPFFRNVTRLVSPTHPSSSQTRGEGAVSPTEESSVSADSPSSSVATITVQETIRESVGPIERQTGAASASSTSLTTEEGMPPTQTEQSTTEVENERLANPSSGGTTLGT